jgi:hypothetical protein
MTSTRFSIAVFNNSKLITMPINKTITAQSKADICLYRTAAIIKIIRPTTKCTIKEVSSFSEK